MKIGIDGRCLEEKNISGVGEYTLELLLHLLEIDKKNRYIIFSNSYKQAIGHIEKLAKFSNVKIERYRWPNKLFNFSLWYFGYPKIDRLIGGVNLFFAPNINFLAVSKNCPLILTLHDLSFERYPEFFSRKTRLWHFFFVNPRKLIRKAEKIIAVSESTKEDLEKLYGVSSAKISVIRHGVGKSYGVVSRNNPKLLEVQKKYDLPYKFILYLGNVDPRKNITSIIRAYDLYREKDSGETKYKLVIAGQMNAHSYKSVFQAQKSKYIKDITFIGYVDGDDKPYIYNLSSIFIYPSFFEGFGLPVLEAMACGKPIICSNSSSFPEVVEKAAITIDPDRPDEMAEILLSLLKSNKLQDRLSSASLNQAKKFSWEKCAQETLDLFQKISSNRLA
ncbi:MAG: glycosyltransferase family 1 protein [Parcubacteria group bacterium]|jgi:glycosyltransferase involved in cell wall biosynthesis